jgi:hypothetical protein
MFRIKNAKGNQPIQEPAKKKINEKQKPPNPNKPKQKTEKTNYTRAKRVAAQVATDTAGRIQAHPQTTNRIHRGAA